MCPGVGPEGWLRCFAHPFGGVGVLGACAVPCFGSQHPVFAPGSLEVAAGFWSFVPCSP